MVTTCNIFSAIGVIAGREEKRAGMDIPIYYDPMIAKLCTYADTREEAMDRMIRAVDEYEIVGLTTTLNFGKYVMKHSPFHSSMTILCIN